MALVGNDFYVANTDAVRALPVSAPATTRIERAGVKVVDLPAGPLNHHWTKNLIASRDGSKLYVTVGSNSNVAENGMAAEEGPRGDLGGRPRQRRAPRLRHRPAQSERHGLGAGDRRAVDGRSTSATRSAATWCPTT